MLPDKETRSGLLHLAARTGGAQPSKQSDLRASNQLCLLKSPRGDPASPRLQLGCVFADDATERLVDWAGADGLAKSLVWPSRRRWNANRRR